MEGSNEHAVLFVPFTLACSRNSQNWYGPTRPWIANCIQNF